MHRDLRTPLDMAAAWPPEIGNAGNRLAAGSDQMRKECSRMRDGTTLGGAASAGLRAERAYKRCSSGSNHAMTCADAQAFDTALATACRSAVLSVKQTFAGTAIELSHGVDDVSS